MNESKIFCSVIIFTLGIYTIILIQYELFKLNSLSTSGVRGSGEVIVGGSGSNVGNQDHGHGRSILGVGSIEKEVNQEPLCNVTVVKKKFSVDNLNCGSASEILSLTVQDCSELPCHIKPNVNYSVILNFKPSRNISSLDIETFVRQRKDLKYLHKNRISTVAIEDVLTTLKFSFEFPPHPIFQPGPGNKLMRKSRRKCPTAVQLLYYLGVEIWDGASGIGEICLIIPMLIQF